MGIVKVKKIYIYEKMMPRKVKDMEKGEEKGDWK